MTLLQSLASTRLLVPHGRSAGLREAGRHLGIAWYFALSDTRARYKRSVLGPFWLVLGTAIGVAGLGFVWSLLMNADRAEFVPKLTAGLIVWTLIAGCILGASSVFMAQASVIKNIKTPSWRISLQLLFQQVINFAHNLVVLAIVLVIYPGGLSWSAILALPGLVLLLINLFWVIQLLGFLGARFRDLEPLIAALMPIAFFLTPVLYQRHQLGDQSIIVALNPLAYWIEVVRDPLHGAIPGPWTYLFCIATAVIGCAAAAMLTRSKGHRLAFWV